MTRRALTALAAAGVITGWLWTLGRAYDLGWRRVPIR